MSTSGRPPFEPTDDQRRQVAELMFVGMPQRDIAQVIGVSTPTLRKVFRIELRTGGLQKRAEVVAGLCRLGISQGNVQALKKLEEMGRLGDAQAGKPVAELTQGKKGRAQAQAEAIAATSARFRPIGPPKLAVVGGQRAASPAEKR